MGEKVGFGTKWVALGQVGLTVGGQWRGAAAVGMGEDCGGTRQSSH